MVRQQTNRQQTSDAQGSFFLTESFFSFPHTQTHRGTPTNQQEQGQRCTAVGRWTLDDNMTVRFERQWLFWVMMVISWWNMTTGRGTTDSTRSTSSGRRSGSVHGTPRTDSSSRHRRQLLDNDPSSSASTSGRYYSRYRYYPRYCSTPEEMDTRRIPPLPESSKAGDSRLLQVTAVIRHGARTPWNAPSLNSTCWPNYHPKWDCNLTTWISTPPRSFDETDVAMSGGGSFWMNKKYTALQDPQHNLNNLWGGTCQRGQLLLQGYDQELKNGQFLREAYLYKGDKDYGHDARLRLLDSTTIFKDQQHLEENIYYRSDDDQRTLMSGQIVLRGVLQDELDRYNNGQSRYPILSLHVADREQDVLEANPKLCPRLKEIHDRFQKSQQYQSFIESPQVQLLQDFQERVLQGGRPGIDCLMTTMCTDRKLPDAIDDYQGEEIGANNYFYTSLSSSHNNNLNDTTTLQSNQTMEFFGNPNDYKEYYGEHMFQRLAQLDAMPVNLLYTANKGEFSKVAMGPLWKEMMHHITAATNADVTQNGDSATTTTMTSNPTPAKFALFSAHDSTLLPLLASLGAWKIEDWWPSYASMMIIEVHEINFDGKTDTAMYKSDHAFRLIYNGQVWTSRIEGCPAEPEQFCDLTILFDLTEPMIHRNCALQYPQPETYQDHVKQAQDVLKTQGGQWAVGVVALMSFVFGMLTTVTFVCCCCSNRSTRSMVVPPRRQRHLVPRDDSETDLDGIAMGERPVKAYRDDAGPTSSSSNSNSNRRSRPDNNGGGYSDTMMDEEEPVGYHGTLT